SLLLSFSKLSPTDLPTHIDFLESSDTATRLSSAKQLLGYVLYPTQTHITSIKTHTNELINLNALPYIVSALSHISSKLDTFESEGLIELANAESTVYLSLLFLVVACGEEGLVERELDFVAEDLIVLLFGLVGKLADGNRKHYPVKKLLLTLWRVFSSAIGSFSYLRTLKNGARLQSGLPAIDYSSEYLKSTPQDLHNFSLLCSIRYPGYILPDPLYTIYQKTNIQYPILSRLIDPNAIPNSVRRYMVLPNSLQPITGDIPLSIKEQSEMVQKYLYVSLANVQIATERYIHEENVAPENIQFRQGSVGDKEKQRLERIERVYARLLPNMASYVSMLVRLLYYVNLGNNSPQNTPSEPQSVFENANVAEMSPEQRLEFLDKVDLNRHKEVVTKAVAAILLSLLKAFKCNHVLKSEYVAQLLVDNNCAILILKMLSTWFQPVNNKQNQENMSVPGDANAGYAPILKYYEEPEELNFFSFSNPAGTAPPAPQPLQTMQKPNWRNFFTVINLLRILEKMTKSKQHRVLALVQWKASAVLKRVMRIGHDGLQLYTLKLLKQQVGYLGKKWRANNMKVITSIFMHLRPDLNEEFLSGDLEVDLEDALAQEQHHRAVIQAYHHRVYNISINEEQPGLSTPQNVTTASVDAAAATAIPGAIKPHHDETPLEFSLDQNFMENYNLWLESEVFSPTPIFDDFYYQSSPLSPTTSTASSNTAFETKETPYISPTFTTTPYFSEIDRSPSPRSPRTLFKHPEHIAFDSFHHHHSAQMGTSPQQYMLEAMDVEFEEIKIDGDGDDGENSGGDDGTVQEEENGWSDLMEDARGFPHDEVVKGMVLDGNSQAAKKKDKKRKPIVRTHEPDELADLNLGTDDVEFPKVTAIAKKKIVKPIVGGPPKKKPKRYVPPKGPVKKIKETGVKDDPVPTDATTTAQSPSNAAAVPKLKNNKENKEGKQMKAKVTPRVLTKEEVEKRSVEAEKQIRFISREYFEKYVLLKGVDPKKLKRMTWFIFFGEKSCPYCKRLNPRWLQVQQTLSKFKVDQKYNLQIAKIDCTNEIYDWCIEQGADGFPTLLLFYDGKRLDEYDGEIDSKEIYIYVKSKAVSLYEKNILTTPVNLAASTTGSAMKATNPVTAVVPKLPVTADKNKKISHTEL
ncbi:Factor arrest protein 11, partial [Nowakowskiella sp. JEL0407]